MNTNSKIVGFILAVVAGMLASQSARAVVVYNNSSNRLSPEYFAQTTGYEMGDEVVLYTTNAWGYRFITNFVFEYYGLGFSGDETARLRIYSNDGAVYGTNNGTPFYEPGTMLFDSGNFAIGATAGSTISFNGTTLGSSKGFLVPSNFTWTVEFGGVTGGESAGLAIYGPPTVGSSYADYWEATGGVWGLRTNSSGGTLDFGAFAEAKVDNTKPSCSITTPADKQRLFYPTNNTLAVTGKAADPSGIALVLYRIGNPLYGTNAFTPMSGTLTPTWSVSGIPMQPGTNFFHVKSVDGSGNESAVAVRKYSYVVTNRLTVITIGSGSVSPALGGTDLEINRDYTMTASPTVSTPPGPNYIFSNWLSSISVGTTNIASANTKLTFNMKTNMVIVADFETNRFISASGKYYGLFTDEITPMTSHERSGLFILKTDSKQKFSGTLYLDGNTLGFSGLLGLNGQGTSKPVARKGKSSLLVDIQMTFDGSDSVSGTVRALSNAPSPYVIYPAPFTSALTGFKAGFNLTNQPATNLVGAYTMVVDVPSDPLSPKGYGYGLITLKTNGSVSASGSLGDYAALKTITVEISKNGDWPMYGTAYKGILPYQDKNGNWLTAKENNGMIMGWMKFTNNTGIPSGRELLDGSVSWIKYPNTNNFYLPGFTNHNLAVFGSAYTAPTNSKTTRALTSFDASLGYGYIATQDGNLLSPFTNNIFMNTNNAFTVLPVVVNTQKVSFTVKSGKLGGGFSHPNDPIATKKTVVGAVLQDVQIGYGVFKGTNSTGSFLLESF